MASIKTHLLISGGLSALAGALVAGVCLTAALDNNNQGEFRDLATGALVLDSVIPLIATTFGFPCVLVAAGYWLVFMVWRR